MAAGIAALAPRGEPSQMVAVALLLVAYDRLVVRQASQGSSAMGNAQ